jgi:hypothetical protein
MADIERRAFMKGATLGALAYVPAIHAFCYEEERRGCRA